MSYAHIVPGERVLIENYYLKESLFPISPVSWKEARAPSSMNWTAVSRTMRFRRNSTMTPSGKTAAVNGPWTWTTSTISDPFEARLAAGKHCGPVSESARETVPH